MIEQKDCIWENSNWENTGKFVIDFSKGMAYSSIFSWNGNEWVEVTGSFPVQFIINGQWVYSAIAVHVTLYYSMFTGIDENRKADLISVNVYPNPAAEKVNVEITGSNRPGFKITLVDNEGRRVKTFNLNKGENRAIIMVDDIAPGIYFLQIFNEEKTYTRKVIIK